MRFSRYHVFILFLFAFLFVNNTNGVAQVRDFPVREYTNPEELVTFDRSTSFGRALDVINQFTQKYRGKIIIDRTGTEGSIGISIPPMHWMDALELILRVKQLQLLELPEFYEIVLPQMSLNEDSSINTTTSASSPVGDGEGVVIDLGTRAVRINAIFFEGNRRALQEVGVDWSTLTENVPEAILGQEGTDLPSAEFDGPFVQVNSTGAANVSQNVFDALINFGDIGNTGIEVQALFSAFEADNLGEILASPNIKVLDGVEGRIQVGQDFSIKQRDFAGNVVETFFSVGTILTVTPTIIEQNGIEFIHLDIVAERSSAQPDPVSTIINKQVAETQTLLLPGEATAIAGLYRTEQVTVRRGVPILKDLPAWFFGLRYLFGYNSHDQLMRELVIIIQASIVPSIPERAEQEELPSKFEVLENTRDRFRDNIIQSQRVFQGDSFADELETIEPEKKKKKERPKQEEKPQASKKDSIKVSEVNNDNEQKPPVIADPEVDNPVIELDFDNDDPEAAADTAMNAGQAQVSKQENNVQGDESSARFFVIGGSFRVDQNAINLRNSLRIRGFDALIIPKEGTDISMVAYGGYSSFDEARTHLAKIQENQNANAWIYRMD